MGRRRARTLALLVSVILIALAPADVRAHTEVQQATPGPGGVVVAPVDRVELVFLDPVLPRVEITVRNPDGDEVAGLDAVVHAEDGRSAAVIFDALEEPGDYVVEYEFVALDGDAQADTYRFSIVPADAAGGRSILGPVALALTALVLFGGLTIALRRRSVLES